MWITKLKIFIWGGISLDILSEITFYISNDIPPQIKILNKVIPLIALKIKIIQSNFMKRQFLIL